MTHKTVKRWLPVALCLCACIALLVFAFVPFNRKAREQSAAAKRLSKELEAKVAIIESLPQKQSDLDLVMTQLSRFRASLSAISEVDQVMHDFRVRVEESGLMLWTLNPSVPVLIKLEEGGDSLSRLDLAVLPMSFECRGPFARMGQFLQAEEERSDFCRWDLLAVSADPLVQGVQAKGEVRLFLLPTPKNAEASS